MRNNMLIIGSGSRIFELWTELFPPYSLDANLSYSPSGSSSILNAWHDMTWESYVSTFSSNPRQEIKNKHISCKYRTVPFLSASPQLLLYRSSVRYFRKYRLSQSNLFVRQKSDSEEFHLILWNDFCKILHPQLSERCLTVVLGYCFFLMLPSLPFVDSIPLLKYCKSRDRAVQQ